MKGLTITIFLVDGVDGGITTAEIGNWIGKVTVAPRSQIADLGKRSGIDVKKPGIYFLCGENLENPSQGVVYIGESDNVLDRLTKPDHQKREFWQKAVIVTSKDESLNKGHVKYLESRLIKIASQAKRVKLDNNNNPEIPKFSEPLKNDMENFIVQLQILLPTLGLIFAKPLPILDKIQGAQNGVQVESPIFHMNYSGVDASAQEVNGEFVVFKDSTARKTDTPSLTEYYKQKRHDLLNEGKLTDSANNDYWNFTQNVPFSSPSYAANVVTGTRLNGRVYWKMKESGQTYAEWQESKIEEVEKSETENGVHEEQT